MRNNNSRRPLQFAYPNARSFVRGMLRQDVCDYRNDLFYFRVGSSMLFSCEKKVAKLVGSPWCILTSSGMAAAILALETLPLTKGDIIVHGKIEYGHNGDYCNIDLAEEGVIAKEIDTSDISKIEDLLKDIVKKHGEKAVKIIFFETVGNGPLMPVLDIDAFLQLEILKKINPVIIIDNTLSTNTVIPLAKKMRGSLLRIIGIESATKFYLLNQDLGGILFTFNKDLADRLLRKRKRLGVTPGPTLIQAFQKLLLDRQSFNSCNKRTMGNTLRLAEYCYGAKGHGETFEVSYPNLPNHSQYEYARKNYSNGIAATFFITAKGKIPSSEDLFYRLEEIGAFRNIPITESFGFDKTTVYYNTRYGGYLRIAGGLEEEKTVHKIGRELQDALGSL